MIAMVVFAGGLAAGAWFMGRLRTLPPSDRASASHRPGISVIVPARNEAASITSLLSSLSDAPISEVIVVDDSSIDDTGDIARRFGAVVVRLDGDPPEGWTGKCHACHWGAEAAVAPMLLFLDADVTLEPHAIDRLMSAHDRAGGLISVQPRHLVQRPYEQLSAVCNVVSMMGSGSFARHSRRRQPVAFGPCLLTSRADYNAIGGHAAVRGEVVEDIHLARRYAEVGIPVSVYVGDGAMSFRMYPKGIKQLVEGWSKNLATGARLTDPVAAVATAWWVASCLGFGVLTVRTVVAGPDPSPIATLAAISGWSAVTIQLRWIFRRIGSFSWWTAIAHPIPMWAFAALFVRSAWFRYGRRRATWSGRDVVIDGA